MPDLDRSPECALQLLFETTLSGLTRTRPPRPPLPGRPLLTHLSLDLANIPPLRDDPLRQLRDPLVITQTQECSGMTRRQSPLIEESADRCWELQEAQCICNSRTILSDRLCHPTLRSTELLHEPLVPHRLCQGRKL